MGMSIMCPWCHEVNNLPRAGSVYCKKCHHRADVSPANCDCLDCKPPPWMPDLPPIPLPPDIGLEYLPYLPGVLPAIPPNSINLESNSPTFEEPEKVWTKVLGDLTFKVSVDGCGLMVSLKIDPSILDWVVTVVPREKLFYVACEIVDQLKPREKQLLAEHLADSE